MDQEVTMIEFETVDEPVDVEPVDLQPALQRLVDDQEAQAKRARQPWGNQEPEDFFDDLSRVPELVREFDGSTIPADYEKYVFLSGMSGKLNVVAQHFADGVTVSPSLRPVLQQLQQTAPPYVRFEGIGSGRLKIGPFKAEGYNEEFDFHFGEYTVYLHVNRNLELEECRAYPDDDGIYRDEHPHPHVNTSHKVCLGEAKHLVKSNVQSGHLELIEQLVGNVLSSFNPGDEYIHIGYWVDAASCDSCGRHIIPSQARTCASTGYDGCDNCLALHEDGEWYRNSELIYCDCCSAYMVRDDEYATVLLPHVYTYRGHTVVDHGDTELNGGVKHTCSPACETYYAQRAASVLTTFPSSAEIDSKLDGTSINEDANEEEPQEDNVQEQEVGLEIEFLT